jgi:hypothetical protein
MVSKPGTLFPPALPTNYGYCGEICTAATQCSGNTSQRQCSTAGNCALRCDLVKGLTDATWRCPNILMQCIDATCTFVR